MNRSLDPWRATLALAVLSGCAAPTTELMRTNEPMALQAALSRGRDDLGCANLGANATSREITRPAGPGPASSGEWVAVYAIAVTGCDRQAAYRVVCPVGGRCVAHPVPAPARGAASPSA